MDLSALKTDDLDVFARAHACSGQEIYFEPVLAEEDVGLGLGSKPGVLNGNPE